MENKINGCEDEGLVTATPCPIFGPTIPTYLYEHAFEKINEGIF